MKSILKIGLKGTFDDGDAEITGKVVFSDEDGTEWSHWFLQAAEDESFWIREYIDEDEACYEVLSMIEAEDEDSEADIANEIFADWRNFKHLAMRDGVKVVSVEGDVDEGPKEGEMLKMADISFMDDEEEAEIELEEDEVLVDTSVIWSEDETWVFGIEYLEEEDIREIFSI